MNKDYKNILLFGAGKSTSVLISYLLSRCIQYNWTLTVVDANIQPTLSKVSAHPKGTVLCFNIHNSEERANAIQRADIVISMLPPALHYFVALDCIAFRKNLLTASYLDDNIKALEPAIKQNHLLFICELGLDPGIDHISAMQLINKIKTEGGVINSFKSHCGGLIAPESDDNPWHYKITWNPQNVVNAGKAGAKYKLNNELVEIAYENLFVNCSTVDMPGLGTYAFYPNRDAIPYSKLYGLEHVATFIRTTLRHPDFCKVWQYIIKAGLTDETPATITHNFTTYNQWLEYSLQKFTGVKNFDNFLDIHVNNEDRALINLLFNYIGITSNNPISPDHITSAAILQQLLEQNLKLNPGDKDMILMLHQIDYQKDLHSYSVNSYMAIKGDDDYSTAMAKTVGLPLAIATELILLEEIKINGLHIPIVEEIYQPLLIKLKENGILFKETKAINSYGK